MRGRRCLIGLVTAACVFTVAYCGSDQKPAREESSGSEIRQASWDLEQFLESYFSSWSQGDIEGYRAHFHEGALIAMVSHGKIVLSMGRDEFVELQARELACRNMIERLTSFEADEDHISATVRAHWLLEEGRRTTTGVDRFTLIRNAQRQWKIIALLFYADE